MVDAMPMPSADMDPEEYRKMLLIMLVRTMNGAWSAVEQLYQVVDPEFDRRNAPEMLITQIPGCEVWWPHPETTSPNFMLFEFGAKVGPGGELPDPGAWEYVGDELTRVLLTCSRGRPSEVLNLITQFNKIRQWAEDEKVRREAAKKG